MFLFRGNKDEQVKRLEEREKVLSAQLKEALTELKSTSTRCESAESQLTALQNQNRALNARVQRLSLQKSQLEQQNLELAQNKPASWFADTLQESAAMTAAVRMENDSLKSALKQQARQFEQKMNVFKNRTKTLITSMLAPTGTSIAALTSSAADEAPFDNEFSAPVMMDNDHTAPVTAMLKFDDPAVHAAVMDIVAAVYDDNISEDDAVEKLSKLKCSLSLSTDALQNTPAARSGEERDVPTSPARAPVRAIAADASTSPIVEHRRADAGTDIDYDLVGGPISDVADVDGLDAANTPPSEGSPRSVPALNLAALTSLMAADDLNQPSSPGGHSARSYSSLRSNASFANAEPFLYLSQFVLAQPDKLQRLIQRANSMRQRPSGAGAASEAGGQPALPSLQLPNFPSTAASGATDKATSSQQAGAGSMPRIPGPRIMGFGAAAANAAGAVAGALTGSSGKGHELLTHGDDTKASSDKPRLPKAPAAGGAPKIAILPAGATAAGGKSDAAGGSKGMMKSLSFGGQDSASSTDQHSGGAKMVPKMRSVDVGAMMNDMPGGMDDDKMFGGGLSLAVARK